MKIFRKYVIPHSTFQNLRMSIGFPLNNNTKYKVGTSNHMHGKAIWDELPECIFENFEITGVKQGQFQIFQKWRGWFIPKIARNKHVITG